MLSPYNFSDYLFFEAMKIYGRDILLNSYDCVLFPHFHLKWINE